MAMCGVLFVVVGLDTLFSFLGQLDDRRANYMIGDVALHVVYLIPRKIHEYMPICCMIGCMVGLSPLVSYNELTVIRAIGVSLWRVVLSAMKPAFFMMCIALFLGEYIVPSLVEKADTKRAIARSVEGVYLGDGVWYREGNSFFYFSVVNPSGILHGVNRYDFNEDKHLLGSLYAKQAVLRKKRWFFKDVQVVRYVKGNFVKEDIEIMRWRTGLSTMLLKTAVMDPWGMSLSGLRTHGNYLKEQSVDSGLYDLVFWTKLLRPISIFALVLIGISLMVGTLRSSHLGLRLFVGVLVGVSFMLLQNLLGPASLVFGLSPALSVLIPSIVTMIIGTRLLKRVSTV